MVGQFLVPDCFYSCPVFVCLLCLLSVWHNNRSLSRIFQTLQRKVRQPVCHVTHLPFGKPWPCGVRFNLLTCDVCLRPTLSSCCGLSTCQYVLSTYFCGKNTDRAVRVKNLLCEPALVLLYVVAMFRLLTSCFFTLVFAFLLFSFSPFLLFSFLLFSSGTKNSMDDRTQICACRVAKPRTWTPGVEGSVASAFEKGWAVFNTNHRKHLGTHQSVPPLPQLLQQLRFV